MINLLDTVILIFPSEFSVWFIVSHSPLYFFKIANDDANSPHACLFSSQLSRKPGFVDKLINHGAKLIGLGARDTLRLEAGLCLYGNDLNEKTSPIEANLKWAIPKSRVNTYYPGSDIIKKQIDDGVKTLRVGIKPETRVIARGNTKIFDQNNKEIGKVTSGTFGPSVECSIAMGYVENNYSPTNTKIFLEVRGKKIPANVCDLPFYKKNYVKGEKNVWS